MPGIADSSLSKVIIIVIAMCSWSASIQGCFDPNLLSSGGSPILCTIGVPQKSAKQCFQDAEKDAFPIISRLRTFL